MTTYFFEGKAMEFSAHSAYLNAIPSANVFVEGLDASVHDSSYF